jgi:hypothetical protein
MRSSYIVIETLFISVSADTVEKRLTEFRPKANELGLWLDLIRNDIQQLRAY